MSEIIKKEIVTTFSLDCDCEIQRRIFTVRGLQVMLAPDLADILYSIKYK